MILNSVGNFLRSFCYEDTKKTSKLKLYLSSLCSSVSPLGMGPRIGCSVRAQGQDQVHIPYDDKMKTRQLKVSANWL